MPSSLGRNSEQNDTNRGNPHKALSVRMRYIRGGLLLPPPNSHNLPEVPMNTRDELLPWPALHRLEATYWHDVDFNEGRTAHEFFTPEGVKVVGHNRFEGREEIREFYEWRARQTGSTAMHKLGVSGVKAVRPDHQSICSVKQRTLRDSAGHSQFLWWCNLSDEASITLPSNGGGFDH
jgi:hypothetical protein